MGRSVVPKPRSAFASADDRSCTTPIGAHSKEDTIRSLETVIVDVPLRRSHFHASGTHGEQSYVFVTLTTEAGAIGVGEGVTPGGSPFWGGESVETIKTVIDRYLAPAIVGCSVFALELILERMDRAAAGNQFAKAAVDIAVHDVVGKLLNAPVSVLYGGRRRDSIPVLWALATATYHADLEDAAKQLQEQRHRRFKIKIGKGDPAGEAKRALATAAAIQDLSQEASCTVDLNQAWDEPTAMRWLPAFQEAGIVLVEQPLAGWNVAGMARLAKRLDMPIMADEGLWDFHDAFEGLVRGATDVLGVKVAKGGGIRRAYKAAAVAEAAGAPCYGGMALESSIGTGASLQLFSALPALEWGCELIGPLLIADDFSIEPIRYENFEVVVPNGPGLGVKLDREKVEHYRRR
ncbi:MAG TPA: muconate cycloisomerase family protein [Alphaproteobacteria bacterium]|nr:muconate cycloisomerase family protein [Alphaproteobacteria bacterium]